MDEERPNKNEKRKRGDNNENPENPENPENREKKITKTEENLRNTIKEIFKKKYSGNKSTINFDKKISELQDKLSNYRDKNEVFNFFEKEEQQAQQQQQPQRLQQPPKQPTTAQLKKAQLQQPPPKQPTTAQQQQAQLQANSRRATSSNPVPMKFETKLRRATSSNALLMDIDTEKEGSVSPQNTVNNLLILQYLDGLQPLPNQDIIDEAYLVNMAFQASLSDIFSTFSQNERQQMEIEEIFDKMTIPDSLNLKVVKVPSKKEYMFGLYEGTIRYDSLQEVLEEGGLGENLLSDGTPIKGDVAFQAEDNNPNGVLAVSLSEALNYLNNLGGPNTFTKLVVDGKEFEYSKCIQIIIDIKNAARNIKREGQPVDYKEFSTALLQKYLDTLITGGFSEDKLISLVKVYGSLMNKGISDTAQGGEAIKVWLLHILEIKKNQSGLKDEPTFWDCVHGIPFLKLVSSDKIASALYIRLTQFFKGGVCSIQPVKTNGGESSIFYLQKKFVGLMIAMSNGPNIGEDRLPFDGPIENEIRGIFNSFYYGPFRRVLSKTLLVEEDIFPKIDEIVKCLYKLKSGSEFKNIHTCVDYLKLEQTQGFIRQYIAALMADVDDGTNESLNVVGGWPLDLKKNKDCIDLLFNAASGFYNYDLEDYDVRMENLDILLTSFGTLITDLSVFVEKNKTALEAKFNSLTEDTPFKCDFVYSMLAETVGYYDGCKDLLIDKTPEDIVRIYLDISKEEIPAAIIDTSYGHDQEHLVNRTLLQQIEALFSQMLYYQDGFDKFSKDLKANVPNVKEAVYVKAQLDNSNHVAVTTCDYRSVSIKKTDSVDKDPINEHILAENFDGIQYSGGISAVVDSSIDFYVGKIFEVGSKIPIRNQFETIPLLLDYLIKHPYRELRTPSTYADGAAPSGCSFVVSGKIAVSYHIFKNNGRTYIYCISTYNLDPSTKNTIKFNHAQCFDQSIPIENRVFFTPEEMTRYSSAQGDILDLFNSIQDTSPIFYNDKKNKIFMDIRGILNTRLNSMNTLFYTDLRILLRQITSAESELKDAKNDNQRKKANSKLNALIKSTYIGFIELTKREYKKLFDLYDNDPEDSNASDEVINIDTLFKIINGVSPSRVEASGSSSHQPAPSSQIKPFNRRSYKKEASTSPLRSFESSSLTPPSTPTQEEPEETWFRFIQGDAMTKILTEDVEIDINDKNKVIKYIVDTFCGELSSKSKTPQEQECRDSLDKELKRTTTLGEFLGNKFIKNVYDRFRLKHKIIGYSHSRGGSRQTKKQKRYKKNKRTTRLTKKCKVTSKPRRKTRRLYKHNYKRRQTKKRTK